MSHSGGVPIPTSASDLVDVAVGREQPDPGQHPHQVADPERDEDQEQQEALAAFRVAGDVVGDRVPDREAEDDRRGDVDERVAGRRPVGAAGDDARERLLDEADVPFERVPDRDRLQEGVDLAHRHREHRVGGDDDEQEQPEHPRGGEPAPEAAIALGHVDFTSDQAVSQSPSASALSGPWTNPFLNCSSRRIVVVQVRGDQFFFDDLLRRHPGQRLLVADVFEVDEALLRGRACGRGRGGRGPGAGRP